MNIKDKVAIVTGASSGIGAAAARRLAADGAKLVLVARRKDRLDRLQQELPDALALKVDMTQEQEIRQMVEKAKSHYGRVDILINNAGQGYRSPIEKINTDKFRYLFELNIIGVLTTMKAVIPIMRSQGWGLIVNISSGTTFMYLPGVGAYSATKRALNGLTLTARAELEPDNIKVCLVYPYMTDTEFFQSSLASGDMPAPTGPPRPDMQAADSAEYVAEKILEAIRTEAPEVKAHEWMGKTGS